MIAGKICAIILHERSADDKSIDRDQQPRLR